MRRAVDGLVAAAVGVLLAVAGAATAHADPPGPTDYQSSIVAIEPETPTIEPGIVGGDSFFELRVDPGVEVFVVGYQGEDTIWFRPDGTVWENRNSPSTYLNADRLGGGSIPPTATPDAAPDWEQVASDGHWAWHDHRAHWMQEARPFGRGPGDRIVEAVIPLVVDDVEVDVTVVSTWQPAPSPLPAIAGGLAGLAAGLGAVLLRRRGVAALVAFVPVVVLAVVVGVWQFASLPPETGPRPVWWVLPTIAAISLVVGLIADRRSASFVADGAQLLLGVELAVWGFLKRDGLTAAIIPSDAPGWLDRFATATALGSGLVAAGLAVWWLASPTVNASRAPTGSPRPAHR